MNERALQVRSAVMSAVRRGRGDVLPEAVIELALKYAGEELAQGKQWGTIAWEVGIARRRLEAFWSARERHAGQGLVRVVVREDEHPEPGIPTAPEHRALALSSPNGWRLEGLSLEEAVQALRVLG
jgi:hypothetical protein